MYEFIDYTGDQNISKTIVVKGNLKVQFVNSETSYTTVEINDPPAWFIIPRVGERFIFGLDERENVVIEVCHRYDLGVIQIWYDFFMGYKTEPQWVGASDRKSPKEKFVKDKDGN